MLILLIVLGYDIEQNLKQFRRDDTYKLRCTKEEKQEIGCLAGGLCVVVKQYSVQQGEVVRWVIG